MSPAVAVDERSRIRVALERRRATRAAEALQSTQALERRLERQADREIRQTGQIARASAGERRLMRETAIARRRDALTRALEYPMSGAELIAACQHSTLAAKVPAGAFEDVSQALALYVIRRHGREPMRAKVSASGLQRLATALYLEKRRKDERATGARAAAEELRQWRAQDHRAAMAGAARSGDLVWSLAAHRPAPGAGARPMSADEISRRLPISVGQAQALALAINTSNVRPLTSTERVQWMNARRAILKRYPDALALMLAVRPETYAAEILTDAAIRAERRRAEIGSRGSHLAGASLTMALQLRPILRRTDQRLSRADRIWSYGLEARTERAALA